ncbi:MAG: DUF4157 domain-containing protein [Desulfobacterales bacterium]|nr:MAG: DUF4157 domain-containing protein [Desulfobacterales bacterium]
MQTFAWKRKPPVRIFSNISVPSLCHRYDSQRAFVSRSLRSVGAQAQPTIGAPDDAYEQEADRVADEVMRMPEKSLQHRPLKEETEELRQAKKDVGHSPKVTPSLASKIGSTQGGGQPLSASERAFFEPRFGHDFSRVRIHTDARAAESALAVAARAYTVGQDVVFGAGTYGPATKDGRRLLAHELTHVIQQGNASAVPAEPNIGAADNVNCHLAFPMAERIMGGPSDRISPNLRRIRLQRSPDVGFVVHRLDRNMGQLDNPEDDGAASVSWPLSFSVTAPLEAEADVEVTGAAGDPCVLYHVGFLQTVHQQWLHLYYWGQSAGHGSTIVRYGVPLPIRDGDPATMWYEPALNAVPAHCNSHARPSINDYPTLFLVPKVRMNALTGQPNYLTGVSRGMHFVTTLVAAAVHPAGLAAPVVQPLRFFYWNYLMDITFQSNHAEPNAAWPFVWKKNKAHPGGIHSGADPAVPYFTAPTAVYNANLVPNVNERA